MSVETERPVIRHHWRLGTFLALAGIAIFAADLFIDHGYAVWVLYLPICVAVAWFERPREAYFASALATVLIAIGGILSLGTEHPIATNVSRFLEAITIWLAVVTVSNHRKAEEKERRAAEALEGANIRLGGIINGADDAIICADAAGKIAIFNPAAEAIFGYNAAEIVGMDLDLLLPGIVATSHADIAEALDKPADEPRRPGQRSVIKAKRKDGGEFRAEVSIATNPGGGAPVLTVIARDISDRVKAEALLRNSENRLRIALSAGHLGVFDVDEKAGIASQDALALSLIGLPENTPDFPVAMFFECIDSRDRDIVLQSIQEARSTGGEYRIECRVPLKDGSERWIAAAGLCELDVQGKPLRTVGVVRDITDRKQMELALEARVAERTKALREEIDRRQEAQAALLQSQKLQAVGELAGGIAHDFNNLLTIIAGNLELAALRGLDEETGDYVRRAIDASQMGERLARRLLAIGRRQRLAPVAVDLNKIALRMIEILRRTLSETIEIRTALAGEPWLAYADVSEVESAILNLAINARDAMPNGGTLEITTSNKALTAEDIAGEAGLTPGDYVVLTVSDTGQGIAPEILPRVIEPYFTTKRPGRGTGLGLSTIYGFAKQSLGHLTIQSEIGKGTLVRLYLPRASDRTVRECQSATATLEAEAEETILIIETDAETREVAAKRLNLLGYRIVSVETGAAALDLLARGEPIDLVFCDMVLPCGMSGFDILHWTKSNRPAIKMLMTTDVAGTAARTGEDVPGEVVILYRPYALTELARAVRDAIAGERHLTQ